MDLCKVLRWIWAWPRPFDYPPYPPLLFLIFDLSVRSGPLAIYEFVPNRPSGLKYGYSLLELGFILTFLAGSRLYLHDFSTLPLLA